MLKEPGLMKRVLELENFKKVNKAVYFNMIKNKHSLFTRLDVALVIVKYHNECLPEKFHINVVNLIDTDIYVNDCLN